MKMFSELWPLQEVQRESSCSSVASFGVWCREEAFVGEPSRGSRSDKQKPKRVSINPFVESLQMRGYLLVFLETCSRQC